MPQEETPFRGVPVFMGGREYIVPSLSTRQFRDNYKLLTRPIEGDTEQTIADAFASYIPLIGLAIRRNYPDVTDDALWDLLDLSTFKVVMAAIQSASGLRTVKTGEAGPVASQSTGDGSTPA
jgi:hypothetical protein